MFDEIKEWSAEQIETRKAAIAEEIKTADGEGLDKLNEELNAIEARSKALAEEAAIEKRRADMAAVAAGAGVPVAKAPEPEKKSLAEIRKSPEYENAYAEYIKTGDAKECRALLTELVEGEVPIPTYLDEKIGTDWQETPILSRVRQTQIKGTAKYPFEYSATDAAIHTEGGNAPTEEELELGTVTLSPEMIKKWITISDEVMALKGQAFLDYIYNEIEYRILLKAENVIVGKILDADATTSKTAPGVPALTPTEISFATIFNALAELSHEATRPVIIMNRKVYFNNFMTLTDNNGNPIFNIVGENGKPTYYLWGHEVLFNDTLSAGEGASADGAQIIVGDLDGALVNLPEGMGVKFTTDPYTLSEKDMIKIVGRMYAGVAVVREKFFCKITVDANP